MRPNRLRELTKDGRVALGAGIGFNDPDLVEFCGELGFDFVFFDGEHGGATPEVCRGLQRAADVAGVETIARVPHNDRASIGPYLDVGVWNLIVPHVNTAGDAERAVGSATFGAPGQRGAAAGSRAARYGIHQTAAEYFQAANEQVLIIPMVEEEAAIRDLDAITAVDGINAAFVGAQDLSLSMAKLGQAAGSSARQAADSAIQTLRGRGMIVGAPASDVAEARRITGLGVQLVVSFVPALYSREARHYLGTLRDAIAI